MIFDNSPPQRRFLVPEVVQTSAMDCGPAALKALLEGFGINVSYGRLREACQTDVDGTSIDTLEQIANQLGLEAQQMMVPLDHLFLPNAQLLPALTVIRLPNGLTHFVIIWREHGQFVQIMDPGTGRRWVTKKRLLEELYIHIQAFPAEVWYDWASSDGFCDPLRQRLAQLQIDEAESEQLLQTALETSSWKSLAALDAATRMVETLVRTEGLQVGTEAARVLERFFQQAQQTKAESINNIPQIFWSIKALPEGEEQVLFQATVILQVTGIRESTHASEALEIPEPLPPELAVALAEPASSPERDLWQTLKEDGFLAFPVLLLALVLATLGITIEALLFKGLLDISQHLGFVGQRVGAIEALFAFLFIMLLLEVPMNASVTRMGRRLENRLRLAFLEKIPRLGDRYFHSRLTSDMTERAYELRIIRKLPELAFTFLHLSFTLVLTTIGIIWLSPNSLLLAILASGMVISLSFLSQPLLREQDLRFRTHEAALSRFYLDALLGLVPIRTHGAERSFRNEYESLLVNWFHAGFDLARYQVLIIGVESLVNTGLAVWILFDYVAQSGQASGVLVLLYWILRLPALGTEIANTAQQYPTLRNRVLRLLEPLNAPEETEMWYEEQQMTSPSSTREATQGIAIELANVNVQAGGHLILQEISAQISAGEHVAIVGSSGAGKSSLVGLLLGWYHPATGTVRVNGELLQGQQLHTLRQETAWVDPSVQIWNRSLRDNLYYGTEGTVTESLETIIEQADLLEVLKKLPDKEQTPLGEGGGLVSGGEGQRVRLGRAMLRPNVRLVILDEPFRGLDREKRRILLERARQYWQTATLLFISHDVGDTQTFERVLVVEEGRVIEDEAPAKLMQQDSRYRALLKAEKAVRQELWKSAQWRHLWLEKGQLLERNLNYKDSH